MASHPPETPPPYYRKPRATFQPRFTLSLLYLFAFFAVYCLLLVSPTLFEVAQTVPPGPEQQAIVEQAVKEGMQPRLWVAVVLSAVTTTMGAHYRLLPGLRAPR